ncbi:MAG: CoA-transferase [Brooklawnia sp.]|jgi:3-oxoacid CoA-transferase B subunit
METLTKEQVAVRIARNVAALFNDTTEAMVINLGVGIPNMVANYLDNDLIYVQGENGMLGVGALAEPGEELPDLINSGRQPVLETPGCMYFDSAFAFGMIRGGHVDAAVIGGLEVSRTGDIANWIVPGAAQLGVGGAMDLVNGAKRLIISMRHTDRDGNPKLLDECSLPLTAIGKVNTVVTEYAVFDFDESGPVLVKKAAGITDAELRQITGFDYRETDEVGVMVD